VKNWRMARKMSANELGRALGYRGRENVKKIESGTIPISGKFERQFEAFKNKTQARERRERKIQTRYALPPRIKILARPRKCVVCKEWFIFPNTTDRICTGRECKREYAMRLKLRRQRKARQSK
jgi:hypothetical protein